MLARWYPDPGTITVRLRVTDSEGDIAEASTDVRINAKPVAGFIYQPSPPVVDKRVVFSSTSKDAEGPLPSSAFAWDFDGGHKFDDAVGETVTVSFAKAGKHVVRLRVVDSDGSVDLATRKVRVQSDEPRLLSPFPIVRLAGELTSGGSTKIQRLSVRAPKKSKATVRCLGRGCPFEERVRTVKQRRVTFPEIERRLNPGIVIEIYVTQHGRIGKFTRFKLRDGEVPKRKDRCVAPGSRRPIDCPRS